MNGQMILRSVVLSQLQRFFASVAFIFATGTLKHRRVASEVRNENSNGHTARNLCGD